MIFSKNTFLFSFLSIFFKKCQPFFIVALSNNLQSNKQRHTDDIKITGPTEHFKIKWEQRYLVGNNLPSPDSNRVIVHI